MHQKTRSKTGNSSRLSTNLPVRKSNLKTRASSGAYSRIRMRERPMRPVPRNSSSRVTKRETIQNHLPYTGGRVICHSRIQTRRNPWIFPKRRREGKNRANVDTTTTRSFPMTSAMKMTWMSCRFWNPRCRSGAAAIVTRLWTHPNLMRPKSISHLAIPMNGLIFFTKSTKRRNAPRRPRKLPLRMNLSQKILPSLMRLRIVLLTMTRRAKTCQATSIRSF